MSDVAIVIVILGQSCQYGVGKVGVEASSEACFSWVVMYANMVVNGCLVVATAGAMIESSATMTRIGERVVSHRWRRREYLYVRDEISRTPVNAFPKAGRTFGPDQIKSTAHESDFRHLKC